MRVIQGDLTKVVVESDKTIVVIAHQCNCRGAFGSGLAAAMKTGYPKVYYEYIKLCGERISLGDAQSLYGCIQPIDVGNGLTVVNCFSQLEQGKFYDIRAIKHCMNELKSVLDGMLLEVVILLPDNYGSGIAGGDKVEIHKTIEEILPEVVWVQFVKDLMIII